MAKVFKAETGRIVLSFKGGLSYYIHQKIRTIWKKKIKNKQRNKKSVFKICFGTLERRIKLHAVFEFKAIFADLST